MTQAAICAILLSCACALPVHAQDSLLLRDFHYVKSTNAWLTSSNAATANLQLKTLNFLIVLLLLKGGARRPAEPPRLAEDGSPHPAAHPEGSPYRYGGNFRTGCRHFRFRVPLSSL